MIDFTKYIANKIVNGDFFSKNSLFFNNKTVVFTNGCFDVLHYGHIDYLAKARNLGDILIVGLNSDESVRRLKGTNRPINPQFARASLLAALAFVDFLTIFEDDTPEKLIRIVNPNVLVKGGDYSIDNIVGADFVLNNGGVVTTIPFVNGFSSTNIINQLNNNE